MKVSKYNGLGNDFVVIKDKVSLDYPSLSKELCSEENFDTDGFISVKENPLEMIFYNKDGSRASMCGNGIRCFAKYVLDEGIEEKLSFPVQTLAGEMFIQVQEKEPFSCTVNMGVATFSPEKLFAKTDEEIIKKTIQLSNSEVEITSCFIGTIHTVVLVEDALAELEKNTGEEICHHPLFEQQTNVNFVQILNEKEILVRTFERGVGWTLACGTGCCASVIVAKRFGLVDKHSPITVHLEKGTLEISGEKEIYMTGPAEFEYEKEYKLPNE
ncbi:diaminopimelate epimerase [Pilibacter termitis]|uniref:Diaminopimelate epimerase n=1 Tax=Pilibacter termitis TaxID=263852 RepID=A0A1T4MPC9_9ENTE|nr:diaminopimelate epimerase [Pilibacter termitis]SJZ68970.1 diaminopimelate epimerase [Pilibacter termitis]